jgi:hypothetical protein
MGDALTTRHLSATRPVAFLRRKRGEALGRAGAFAPHIFETAAAAHASCRGDG